MSSTMTSTFVPYQSSPLATKSSPLRDPRTASPSTPRHTAKLWDEYERRAVENAKRRETLTTCGTSSLHTRSQRLSNGTVLDIIKSYDTTTSAPSTPQFDFNFPTAPHRTSLTAASPTTVAICKTCKQAINSTSGVCEMCNKTIILPHTSAEATPLLSPSCRNFASTDLPKLHKESTSGTSTPTTSSPKRRSIQPSTHQLIDPPIRLSSLRPPPDLYSTDSPRPSTDTTRSAHTTYTQSQPQSRKSSLTDPNEPFLRLQVKGSKPARSHRTQPSTPTASARSTRPSSLAQITTPPQSAHSQYTSTSAANYSRHISATPSELSTLYPYISHNSTPPATATSQNGVCRASYSLQNTTSAWDDWDSDSEEHSSDKAGLVGYWRGKKWRGSRGSLSTTGRRDSATGKEEREQGKKDKEEVKRKRRGLVRVLSCGCSEK